MIIIEYEPDKELICEYQGHRFELHKDSSDNYSFGNWYMRVTNDSGEICCDGWIDDSSSIGAYNAMIEACDGAELEHPVHWPVHPAKLTN